MPFWERIVILAAVVLASFALAKLVDLRMRRGHLRAGTLTRYRVLRRSIMAAIVAVALLSGLLVIPQVRAIAGALLAYACRNGVSPRPRISVATLRDSRPA